MSATRLLVLGVVRMYGKAHGYQVRSELLTWSADKWANAQPGSIYHALKKMAVEGLLEAEEAEPGKGGPERTAYRVTPEGETQYQVLLARALGELESEPQNGYALSAALALLPSMSRARAVFLLNQRLNTLRAQYRNNEDALCEPDGLGKPEHVREMHRLWLGQLGATIEWAEKLIARLQAGEYAMAGDDSNVFGNTGRV